MSWRTQRTRADLRRATRSMASDWSTPTIVLPGPATHGTVVLPVPQARSTITRGRT